MSNEDPTGVLNYSSLKLHKLLTLNSLSGGKMRAFTKMKLSVGFPVQLSFFTNSVQLFQTDSFFLFRFYVPVIAMCFSYWIVRFLSVFYSSGVSYCDELLSLLLITLLCTTCYSATGLIFPKSASFLALIIVNPNYNKAYNYIKKPV